MDAGRPPDFPSIKHVLAAGALACAMAGAGKVALWTKADSVTRFDQIEIKPLP